MNGQHTHLGTTIVYTLTKKTRPDIGIYVDRFGRVEVCATKGTSTARIHAELERNWDRILSEIKTKTEELQAPFEKVYEPGEIFLYLGVQVPIMIMENRDRPKDYVRFENNRIDIYVKDQSEDAIRRALASFYHRKCKELVRASIKRYQPEFKVKPRSVSIVEDEKNWGTCDSNRELRFNWKLAMAPTEVIDYIVVHEMCHLVHMNHDRSFWRLVGKILPDYEARSRWLSLAVWRMNL